MKKTYQWRGEKLEEVEKAGPDVRGLDVPPDIDKAFHCDIDRVMRDVMGHDLEIYRAFRELDLYGDADRVKKMIDGSDPIKLSDLAVRLPLPDDQHDRPDDHQEVDVDEPE